MKKNADFRNALGQPDEYFRQSVIDTLNELNREAEQEKRTARPFPLRAVCAFAAALIIAAAGLTLTLRNGIRETMDGRVDMVTNAPAFLAAPDEKLRTIEAEAASIRFRSIRTDGYMIVLTAEAKPKKKGSLILPDTFDPETASPEIIGKTPDYDAQTVRRWAEEHAYSDVLYASLGTPWSSNSRTTAAGLGIESWEIRDDGSAVLTVIGHYLSRTDTYDLEWALRTQPQKYEESGLETFSISPGTAKPGPVLDTELASLQVREAFTGAGGHGINMKIAAVPRHENSLLLYADVDPYRDHPTLIGKTQDYAGQTIAQWAREHGYEELLSVRFPNEYNAEIPTGTRQTADKNGATVFRVELGCDPEAGEVLPEDFVKYEIIPWDLTKENTYDRNGTLQTSTLKTEEAITGNLPFTVSNGFEEREFLASYRMTSDLTDKGPDQEMTVTFFRTSLSDYYEISVNTDDTSLSYSQTDIRLFRNEEQSFGTPGYYQYNAVDSQADGWIINRTSWQLPGDFPETLWMRAVRVTDPSHVTICPMQKITAAGDPQVFETELATFTVREAVTDDAGVYFTVDVKPKDEHVLAVHMDLPVEDIHIHAESIGKQSDFDNQTLPQWAKAHDYELMAVGFSLSPDDSESSPHSYTLENHHVNNDNSMVMYIIDKAQPDTQIYNLFWNMKIWSADKTGTSESDILTLREERGSFPVCVSMEKETTKTVESDLVTMVFHDAVSDGTGVFISTEIRAKNEKTLPLLWDTDFLGSPEILGKTPDYPDQNILQWAREHGYEDLMFIMLMYPTSDTRLNGFSNAFTLQDDGSLAGTIAGLSIPEATLYGLYWAVIPYDMNKAEKYMQETHGLPLDSENNEAGIVPIAVADEAETPETVAVYQLTGTAGKNGQAPETTLSLFRTSRCDYLLFRSEDRQYFGYNAIYTKDNAWYGRNIPYITRTELQEEHAVSILVSWQFPDPLPDTLSIGLYNSHSTTELEPPELEFSRIR